MDSHFNAEATNELEKFLRKCKYQAIEKCAGHVDSDSDILDILEDLCERGADLNHLENERGLALVTHVFWSRILIKFLMDGGANISSRDENGDTVLHIVIREAGNATRSSCHGNTSFTHGIGINIRLNVTNKGSNGGPIYNLASIVKFLLKHSELDPNVINSRGETPLFLLRKKSDILNTDTSSPVEKMLVERGVPDAVPRNLGDFRFMLHDRSYYWNLKGQDAIDFTHRRTPCWSYSKTPLIMAAAENPETSTVVVQVTLGFGFVAGTDSRMSQLEICKRLIERGADVNAKDLQGYTALHHAVLAGVHDCAEYLIEVGADPNLKTASGRDVYDLSICNRSRKCFISGTITPEKKIQMLEIAGAALVLKTMFSNYSHSHAFRDNVVFDYWDMVLDVCNECNLQLPSQEFLDNREFIRANLRNPEYRDEIITRCMNTIARVSESYSKFWTMLQFISSLYVMPFDDPSSYIFQILDFLSSELERIEDFASLEETDINSLSNLVEFFDSLFAGVTQIPGIQLQGVITPDRISQFHSIARLAVACFNKLTQVTKDKKVPSFTHLYVKLFNALTSLRSNFCDVIMSETALLNENDQLLKKLVDLDLRDRDSNSLLHLVLGDNDEGSNSALIGLTSLIVLGRGGLNKFKSARLIVTLLETVDEVKTKNEMGFEPVQTTRWEKWNVVDDKEVLDEFVKMAEKGAHVDARNATYGEPTLREVFEKEAGRPDLAFRFDNLQCACARVLVRNLVPYRKYRVPKNIVDFIHEHAQ